MTIGATNGHDPASFLAYDPLLLVEEMQHRVANEYAVAISIIDMLAADCDNQAKPILSLACDRLLSFATVHHALLPPGNHGVVDLCPYLGRVCSALAGAILAERNIRLILREQPVLLAPRRAWRVALILTELITNAAWHGNWPSGGGIIDVEVIPDGGMITCRLAHACTGSVTPWLGRGARIAEALARELGGHLERDLGDLRTTLLLRFPAMPDSERCRRR
jgi:two-component sensor histidine kinase